MKIASRFILAASIALFASCSESGNAEQDTTATQAPANLPAATADTAHPSQVVTPSASTEAAPAGALNPAHGQPGHRCEIAVGAPLNSSPSASPSPSPSPSPLPTPQTVTPAPSFNQQPAAQPSTPGTSASSGKVNPGHGQPGHDCSVPVGSPLK